MQTKPVEFMPISDLVRWDKNPKEHDLETIKTSIRRFGFVAPIIVDGNTGTMVAGHGRLQALAELEAEGIDPPQGLEVDETSGAWKAPVRIVPFLSKDEAAAYAIADNRLVESGGWNEAALTEVLLEIQKSTEQGLEGIGYDQAALDALLAFSTLSGDSTGGEDDPFNPGDGDDAGGEDIQATSGVDPTIRIIIVFKNQEERKQCLELAGLPMEDDNATTFRWSDSCLADNDNTSKKGRKRAPKE